MSISSIDTLNHFYNDNPTKTKIINKNVIKMPQIQNSKDLSYHMS